MVSDKNFVDIKSKKIIKFSKGFLWGVSTSAYQIEGGIINDWSEWEEERILPNKKEFICGPACDSYNRYKEDIDLVQDLGCGAFRVGIEWSRIEPHKGVYNYKEIEHYRNVLKEIKSRGIKTVVTLWHWTNPVWLTYRRGGWSNKNTVEYFSNYVKLITEELGDYIDFWITLNEPMVHVFNGYVTGKFPPNKRNPFSAIRVFKNLVNAHKQGFDIIHKKYPKAQVSITALINYFEPARKWCLIENFFSYLAHHVWNNSFLRKIENYLDFIAFDYYFHDRIIWRPPFKKNLNKQTTDMGWEIYPEGIYHVLKYLNKFSKPIYIMENGLADASDSKRVEFISGHLKNVHRAISEKIPVKGYFYWSLLDNFEWAAGWAPKFGLYSVNRNTFERKARPSVDFYRSVCKENKISL